MRKILILVFISVIAITSIVFVKFIEYSRMVTEITQINKEYLAYQNSNIQINTIVSLMNKAIEQNKKNNIMQNDDKLFNENNTNSIKIYIETKSSDGKQMIRIPMENLILNDKIGVERVEYAFSDLLFKINDVKYHKKTGQVKQVVFTEISF